MGRIDQATVNRILDTADIVDVVSDYVSLRRRGSGYVGLCPFHNERTPSFSVSKTRNFCKCFSCGEGGSPVNFIMKIEQLTYPEALRFLARKYGIEIEEHEATEDELKEQSERESLFAVNNFALDYFRTTLTETQDGRDIGLSYFRERGINDAMIERFKLGYCTESRDAMARAALAKGFQRKYLVQAGLCYETNNGELRDRFRGRVIYPIFTVSGKVVGFGGRILHNNKDVAKYVNSPESVIYHKNMELYGLYQAKQSISRKDMCLLVEGYMDVISMAQRGVENVVASSGTSLTDGQVRLIHRFTDNVTVIYDSDPAGVKASLRGVDMLLAEGLTVRVLSLPEGEDPDSYAQSHTTEEVEQYIKEKSEDFIRFKTRILLDGTGNDPMARARAIGEVVQSISVIPNEIARTVYITESSHQFGIDEGVLIRQVGVAIAKRIDKENEARQRQRAKASLTNGAAPQEPETIDGAEKPSEEAPLEQQMPPIDTKELERANFLRPYELDLLKYVVRYGNVYLCDMIIDDSGATRPLTVLEYIRQELEADSLRFANRLYAHVLYEAVKTTDESWETDRDRMVREADALMSQRVEEGIAQIRNDGADLRAMQAMEERLRENAAQERDESMRRYAMLYVVQHLTSSSNDSVRQLATELATEKHQLSKIHTRYAKIETEIDRLTDLIPRAIYNLKEAHVEWQIREINAKIRLSYQQASSSLDQIATLMRQIGELNNVKKELAKYLGERILSPTRKS